MFSISCPISWGRGIQRDDHLWLRKRLPGRVSRRRTYCRRKRRPLPDPLPMPPHLHSGQALRQRLSPRRRLLLPPPHHPRPHLQRSSAPSAPIDRTRNLRPAQSPHARGPRRHWSRRRTDPPRRRRQQHRPPSRRYDALRAADSQLRPPPPHSELARRKHHRS